MGVELSGFTARQVVSITGVPYQTLNYWAKIGLVKPSVSAARGSGTRRIYNFKDLLTILVALKLRKAGILGTAMVRILQVLHGMDFDSPAAVAIDITPGKDVVVTTCAGELFSARRHPGQLFLDFRFDCRGAEAELQELLRKNQADSVETRKGTEKGMNTAQPKRAETKTQTLRRRA